MEALTVVRQLHDLAINPRNRSSIVKDQGCLPGLILFLDNEDIQVVKTTLKTLYLLAQHGPNRKIMKEEIGMIASLKTLIASNKETGIRDMACQVHDSIVKGRSTNRPANQTTSFLGKSNKNARVVKLLIDGLYDQTCRELCQEELLGVKGVISFTFDMSKRLCTVRTRQDVSPESLCKAIANTKIMTAQQIVRTDEGNEVFLSFGIKPQMSEGKQTEKKVTEEPAYLPEDEEEETSDKALARIDQHGENNTGGWFSNVSNFLSNTFYW